MTDRADLPARLRAVHEALKLDRPYASSVAADALARIEALEAALKPFTAPKLPSLRRTERDYDENGLRRMMSPMEIAVKAARSALTPESSQ